MSRTVTPIVGALALLLALPVAGCTHVSRAPAYPLDDTVIPNMLVRALQGKGT